MAAVTQHNEHVHSSRPEPEDDLNDVISLVNPLADPGSKFADDSGPALVSDDLRELSQSEIERLVNNHYPDPAIDLRRHASHVSFGDGTIFATSGTYGSILRVSQYVDRADLASRMVTLDYPDVSPPFCIVARADELVNQAQSHRNGFGMRLSQITGDNGTEGLTTPSLAFLGDRWPRIRYTLDDALDFRVDLVCHDHMVVQRMRITNESPFKQMLNLEFNPCFRLRDLDYTARKDDMPIEYQRGPHGRSLILMERSPSGIHDHLLNIVVSLFKDGVAQELNDESVLTIKHELNYRASVEYVSVFKIQSCDLKSGWEGLVIPNTEVNQCFKQMPSESSNWEWPHVDDTYMRWSLRRNLEHILGACSVYIPSEDQDHSSTHATGNTPPNIVVDETMLQKPVSIQHNEGPLIILETPEGDSYFVQQSGSTRFELQRVHEPRGSNEHQRIAKHQMTEKSPGETSRLGPKSTSAVISLTCGDFGDHRVCVSGSYFAFMFMLKMYKQAEQCTFQETSQKELKCAQDSMRRIHETCRGHLRWVSRLARRNSFLSNLWVDGTIISSSSDTVLPPDSPANMPYHILKATEYLKTRNRLSPTWEHLENISDIPIYRLSDHAWIWKALQDVQDLIKRVQEANRTIQTKSGVSQTRRMTPWASQLATGTLDDFLRDVGPLFPSLRMRGSLSKHALNFTVEDMRKQNLRRFTLENDVLKKRMLSVTRSARETRFLFHSRDTVLYYGQSWGFLKRDQVDLFEQLVKAQIQHDEEGTDEARWDNPLRYALALLMARANHQLDRDFEPRPPKANSSAAESSTFNKSAPSHSNKSTEVPAKVLEKAVISQEKGESGAHSERLTVIVQRSLKRQNPHGRLLDISNIVDVPEEWLYKYPGFLDHKPPDISDVGSVIRDGPLLLGNKQTTPGDIVRQMTDPANPPNRYSFVEDVRKSRKQHKRGGDPKSKKYEATSFKALWEHLQKPRFAPDAKKRFVYLKSVDPVRAMICCVASPESERLSLAQFFDRHGKSKPYLFDDTAVALNSWVTEVYFQFFYKLRTGRKSSAKGSVTFGQLKTAGQPICLANNSTGFRIVGDFFDRYWTCHFVDGDIDDGSEFTYADTPQWQQRKVLELILLSRILEKVCTSTEEILDEVERKPSEQQKSVFDDEYDSLEDRSPESLRECERILLFLKKNMIGLREVIDQWDVRESSQGRERPRWTRRDEQKYRKSIKQKRAVLEGHVRDVRTKEIHIEFLLGRVTSAQEAIRSKKSLKEAQNITLFTYVTVFFLPAGLAVSIFSMGDIPSSTVVGWMVLTAIVALVITVSLLYGVIHHLKDVKRFLKTAKFNLGLQEKPAKAVAHPWVPSEKPSDSGSIKWSLKGTLLSLIRLDMKTINDDPASKHV
ncbi:hypothetical protein BJX64DRAFT_301544 [Aspergillus heterothallicus]